MKSECDVRISIVETSGDWGFTVAKGARHSRASRKYSTFALVLGNDLSTFVTGSRKDLSCIRSPSLSLARTSDLMRGVIITCLCDLIEGRDVAVIEAKIAKYQEENAEQIMNAYACKAEELATALVASKGVPAQTEASSCLA
ncbi:hypothetical protein Syun_019316 [Stephania yunnanensis]|uniref:Uncharacterized protein n=1 Tax=Stephania yunnanensis TaxID=152371 RepID=A0AAP0IU03_9MAGN